MSQELPGAILRCFFIASGNSAPCTATPGRNNRKKGLRLSTSGSPSAEIGLICSCGFRSVWWPQRCAAFAVALTSKQPVKGRSLEQSLDFESRRAKLFFQKAKLLLKRSCPPCSVLVESISVFQPGFRERRPGLRRKRAKLRRKNFTTTLLCRCSNVDTRIIT